MRIMIVSRGYPTEKYRMHGIFEYDQAKALAKQGHEVIFASVDMRSIRRWRKWGVEKFKKDGLLIYGINYPIGRFPGKIISYFTVKALKELYKIIQKEIGKPDIIHAHFTSMGYAATKLKQITGIPLLITEHSSSMMSGIIDKKLLATGRKTYPYADKIITVSPSLSSVLKQVFNVQSTYIPNMVDTRTFSFSDQEKTEAFTFIAVGNLIYRKRMDLIVEAFARAFSDNEGLSLTIIGAGPERKKIENIIKKKDLEEKVTLTGKLSRKEIAKHMGKSHCFVLPSRAETFGVVYIEAMSMGLPVIATRCGGPEGFVDKTNGVMIDVDNLDQLVSAMKHMFKNFKEYNSKQIATTAVAKFSPESVSQKIIEEYEQLIGC